MSKCPPDMFCHKRVIFFEIKDPKILLIDIPDNIKW